MKLHRFYNDIPIGDKENITISSVLISNQMRNVLRIKTGDKVCIFDNSGFDFMAVVDKYEKDTVYLRISEKKVNNVRAKRETYLFCSILKKNNFEWVVEKATELGVSHIVPIISNRSEKKGLNKERLQKIIIESGEQSGRGILPRLYEIIDLEKSITDYSKIKLIAWDPRAVKFSIKDLSEIKDRSGNNLSNDSSNGLSNVIETHDVIGVYIGPEGGWTEEEIELFNKNNVSIYSLGPQILRAETAVVAVLSQVVF